MNVNNISASMTYTATAVGTDNNAGQNRTQEVAQQQQTVRTENRETPRTETAPVANTEGNQASANQATGRIDTYA